MGLPLFCLWNEIKEGGLVWGSEDPRNWTYFLSYSFVLDFYLTLGQIHEPVNEESHIHRLSTPILKLFRPRERFS